MANDIVLTFQDYESLVSLAREGARLKGFMMAAESDPTLRRFWEAARTQYGWDPELPRELEAFLKNLEKQQDPPIVRQFVGVRWTEAGEPLPPRTAGAPTRFPENWPPTLEGSVQLLGRPIARTDVDAMLQAQAKKPMDVMCTNDVGLRVGWTPIDQFFL